MLPIPFTSHNITQQEVNEVKKILLSNWINRGPKAEEFEAAIEKYTKCYKAIVLNSATASLFLSLTAFGIGKGDEVITTPMTFSATAAAILQTGAKPIFIDIREDFNMDPSKIEKVITSKTKAIIPVDYAGNPCDYKHIMHLITEKKKSFIPSKNQFQKQLSRILCIADASHSLGATLNNKQASTYADMSVFSFHATKNITTGDGGALILNQLKGVHKKNLETIIKQLSLHGRNQDPYQKHQKKTWQYDIVDLGYKYNMTDIQAAIGLIQLKRYPTLLEKRKSLKSYYVKQLQKKTWALLRPTLSQKTNSACHLLSIRLKNFNEKKRNQLIDFLKKKKIEANVHYIPLPKMTYYKKLGYSLTSLPKTNQLATSQISLPFFSQMKTAQIDQVIFALDQYFKHTL